MFNFKKVKKAQGEMDAPKDIYVTQWISFCLLKHVIFYEILLS